MIYQQLTSNDRYIMAALRKQGLSIQQIAAQLGRHRSTLYRELARNSCHHVDGAYRPCKAQRRTVARRRRSRRNHHYGEADFLLIRRLLRKKWSPEQIVGFIRRFNLMKRRISHETIYQYIWRDKAQGAVCGEPCGNRPSNGVNAIKPMTAAGDSRINATSPSVPPA